MALPKFNQIEADAEALLQRMRDAIEAWYAKHYHRSVVSGTPAISSAEKDDLHRVVASAVQPTQSAPDDGASAPKGD